MDLDRSVRALPKKIPVTRERCTRAAGDGNSSRFWARIEFRGGAVNRLRADLAGAERMKETRFALVEALRVQRVAEVEERVVEVVAELVEERPQEGLEGDDLSALRGQHPDRDHVAAAPVARR